MEENKLISRNIFSQSAIFATKLTIVILFIGLILEFLAIITGVEVSINLTWRPIVAFAGLFIFSFVLRLVAYMIKDDKQ